jgi:hypothetical protein
MSVFFKRITACLFDSSENRTSVQGVNVKASAPAGGRVAPGHPSTQGVAGTAYTGRAGFPTATGGYANGDPG